MRKKLAAPLPQRHGLDPVRLHLPRDGQWRSVREFLADRLPRADPQRIDEMLAEDLIVDRAGPVGADSPYVPDSFLWFHRDLPDERHVPVEIGIVHRDEHVVVADKPHFLASIPRGKHITQTALVRLRQELDLPELSPAHRLDRVTAGLLLFVINKSDRGKYQTMFRYKRIHKEYEAIAPYSPTLELPRTVRSRIVKERGTLAAQEVPGEPNAETLVELAERRDGIGRYRLTPATGRTHQLRVHMSSLGVPILGDNFFPTITDTELDDYRNPLQLLAKRLSYVDPITGERSAFESNLRLAAWPSAQD